MQSKSKGNNDKCPSRFHMNEHMNKMVSNNGTGTTVMTVTAGKTATSGMTSTCVCCDVIFLPAELCP